LVGLVLSSAVAGATMGTMREDRFGSEVARSYDEDVAEMFDPSAVEPAVEVLSRLAEGAARSSSRSARGGSRCRSLPAASTCPGSSSPRR